MELTLITRLVEEMENRRKVALVTIIDSEGSSPRQTGSMMLVDEKGKLLEGTIGGGTLEERVKQESVNCIHRGISKLFNFSLNGEDGDKGLPMICGGKVDVFIKVFQRADKLLIIGAGHIGTQLYKLGKMLNYEVSMVDDREELVSRDRFPEADQLFTGWVGEILPEYPIDNNTSIVIVTHGHVHDQKSLNAVIESRARYIGMIGSKKKIKACIESIRRTQNVSEETLEKIHAPIGLDIGGESPEEIALAIMAEIQAVKYNKSGLPLKSLT